MRISRRSFVKLAAVTAGGAAFGGLGFSLAPTVARAEELAIKKAKLNTSVCCFCAVGCGLLVWTDPATGRAINIEGDPDHPTNEGTLCPKGGSIWQTTENKKRLTKVLYRAPGADKWEEKSWAWALPRIARKVKESRDATFELKNEKDQVVNRTRGIASVGSAAIDNEEGWLLQAMHRALGLVYIESHARI